MPDKEFWTSETLLEQIRSRKYFGENEDGTGSWPDVLQEAEPLALGMFAFQDAFEYMRLRSHFRCIWWPIVVSPVTDDRQGACFSQKLPLLRSNSS